jgi:N-carbamoyl-L-amino-acid hydrolase
MAREIASQSDLEVDFDIPIQIPPTPFAEGIVDLIRQSATELGFSHRDMLSGAGHDAMNVARVAPTGMIFVPCKDGISHNEAESATAPDLAAGAQTLLAALLARAGVVNS